MNDEASFGHSCMSVYIFKRYSYIICNDRINWYFLTCTCMLNWLHMYMYVYLKQFVMIKSIHALIYWRQFTESPFYHDVNLIESIWTSQSHNIKRRKNDKTSQILFILISRCWSHCVPNHSSDWIFFFWLSCYNQ